MLTHSGGPPLGPQVQPRSKPSLTTRESRGNLWLGADIASLRLTESLNSQSPIGSKLVTSTTPRRYSPPSLEIGELKQFFRSGSDDWHGVLIKPLAPETSRDDVKKMLLFSRGFEDSRVVKSDLSRNGTIKAEAFVRFSNPDSAQEAVNALNEREINNGEALVVAVAPKPCTSSIVEIAQRMDALAQEVANMPTSQSSSGSSDGLPTPCANTGQHAAEYITSRQLVSPSAAFAGLGYTSDLFSSTSENSRRLNGNGPADDVLGVYERTNHGLTGTNNVNNYEYYDSPLPGSRAYGVEENERLPDVILNDLSYPSNMARPRRQTTGNPTPSTAGRFGGLPPLSTGGMNAFTTSMTSPVIAATGVSPMATNNWVGSPVNQYNNYGFPVTSHPPANPADQNPPCNTLYVGNLPAQTSEDELKALFCRQRGYKRMCFRTKPQGPMCFVEFEDVGYATKALTELYGRALSNSTKGGVRLSFSKNPLGVRSQNNPANPVNSSNGAANGAMSGSGGVPPPPGFATAMHNPPGLAPPSARQLPMNSPTVGGTPINGAPPGLLPPGRPSVADSAGVFARPPGLATETQSNSRLPPGITTCSPFYPGAIGTPPTR